MILLGLGHRARQGKSLCAQAIAEHCRYVGLSYALLDIGEEVRRYCVEQGLFPDIERAKLSPSQLATLAAVGADKRLERSDHWIQLLGIHLASQTPQVAVVPNLRYPNEAEWVKTRGGFTILVERQNADGSQFISQDRDCNHISETSLHAWRWDFRLYAHSNEEGWLRRQAVALVEYLRA